MGHMRDLPHVRQQRLYINAAHFSIPDNCVNLAIFKIVPQQVQIHWLKEMVFGDSLNIHLSVSQSKLF